jgi:hypothetical protein
LPFSPLSTSNIVNLPFLLTIFICHFVDYLVTHLYFAD